AVASGMRILYGGSVKAENMPAIMAELDVDGALVGGASLDASEFVGICRYRDSQGAAPR
ncbi:MAG: triose-phosphate isomerase, partial [Actinobacteria bacterium]|nr:triose-phosphate isomerase [Actinomycetota bacterium]